MRCVLLLVVLSVLSQVFGMSKQAGDCAIACNGLRTSVLTLEMCREAKRTLPRPKVGDFCSTAMEQGFSDVCVAYCMDQVPVARVSQTCRGASLEMPRPTVRKWCEHGYNQGYRKTLEDLKDYFKPSVSEADPAEAQQVQEEAEAEKPAEKEPEPEVQTPPKTIVATFPITLNDNETYDLSVYEGQNVEDAVVSFCREHVSADVAACIRQLLPDVLERYSNLDEGNTGLRGAETP